MNPFSRFLINSLIFSRFGEKEKRKSKNKELVQKMKISNDELLTLIPKLSTETECLEYDICKLLSSGKEKYYNNIMRHLKAIKELVKDV
jgi:hypothetical protein